MNYPRSLAIIGALPGSGHERIPAGYDEVWTFLSAFRIHTDLTPSNVDLVWDCHSQSRPEAQKINLFDIRDPYRSRSQREWSFSKDKLISKYGHRFSSQLAWQLAWANELRFSHIGLYRMFHSTESKDYLVHAPDIMYMIGRLAAMGTSVVGDPDCVLFRRRTYGFQEST